MIRSFWPNEIYELWNHCNNISQSDGFRTQILMFYQVKAYYSYQTAIYCILHSLVTSGYTPLLLLTVLGATSLILVQPVSVLRYPDFPATSSYISAPVVVTFTAIKIVHFLVLLSALSSRNANGDIHCLPTSTAIGNHRNLAIFILKLSSFFFECFSFFQRRIFIN